MKNEQLELEFVFEYEPLPEYLTHDNNDKILVYKKTTNNDYINIGLITTTGKPQFIENHQSKCSHTYEELKKYVIITNIPDNTQTDLLYKKPKFTIEERNTNTFNSQEEVFTFYFDLFLQ